MYFSLARSAAEVHVSIHTSTGWTLHHVLCFVLLCCSSYRVLGRVHYFPRTPLPSCTFQAPFLTTLQHMACTRNFFHAVLVRRGEGCIKGGGDTEGVRAGEVLDERMRRSVVVIPCTGSADSRATAQVS